MYNGPTIVLFGTKRHAKFQLNILKMMIRGKSRCEAEFFTRLTADSVKID